ncbi:MAG: AAA family ATPase [archaeon]
MAKLSGRIISIVSFKGGVGKTSFAANLACALSSIKKKTIVVDSNFSSPHLALHFGLINPTSTLNDVLCKKSKIEDAIHIHESNVHIIPNYPSTMDNPSLFKNEIKKLKCLYDYVILDCSPSFNNELIVSLGVSDEMIIVSTADYPSLVSTRWAAKIARAKNVNVRGIILNRVRNKKFEISKGDIEEATGLPVIATIPESMQALEASSMLMPVFVNNPYGNFAQNYKQIASIVAGEEYIADSMWKRIVGMISSKIKPQEEDIEDKHLQIAEENLLPPFHPLK